MSNKEILQRYIKEHSFRENQQELFTLASGKKSPYYFNLKQTLFHPTMLDLCIELILERLPKSVDCLAGLTMGADPLIYGASLYAEKSGRKILPIIVRKERKGHGAETQAEGLIKDLSKDACVWLLDDVITTGGSTLKAYHVLKELGFSAKNVLCLIDRDEGGKENFAKHGIELHSIFNLADFRS